jgi:hypothetical protein
MSGSAIDAGADARERMALLVCYLVGANWLSAGDKANIWNGFTVRSAVFRRRGDLHCHCRQGSAYSA